MGDEIKIYGLAENFRDKVELFSDGLLKNQLFVYEKLVGENSPREMKVRLQILRNEFTRRKKHDK